MPHLHRLFFALLLPDAPRRRAAAHRNAQADLTAPVVDDRLQATLAITDDHDSFPTPVCEAMLAIGNRDLGGPVPIRLEQLAADQGAVALRPRRSLPGLRALHAALAGPMQRRALLRQHWVYAPHVTLGNRDGDPWRRPVDPIAWIADEIVLIHGIVGPTRHHILGRWPLAPRQGELFA